jgi:hypothetical protein
MRATILAAVPAIVLVSLATAVATEAPPIFVGGAYIRQHAIDDRHGHVLVPVRGVFQALQADVTYTPPRFVVVRKGGAVIAGLIIGRNDAVVHNRARTLPVAPMRRFGRVYVPLRVIAELAGASVTYSARPRVVDIRVPPNALTLETTSTGALDVTSADETLPIWVYVLVAVALTGMIVEFCRQLALAARRPPRRLSSATLRALQSQRLQLPYAVDASDHHRIG